MKNILIIDVDSDRTPALQLRKPADTPKPSNAEEASKALVNDLASTCEALCALIHMADQNKYGKKEEMVETAKKLLESKQKQQA